VVKGSRLLRLSSRAPKQLCEPVVQWICRDLTSHPISNLVPLPQFASGQHPAQFLGLLTSWAEMRLMDMAVPGMLQNMLVQGCANDKKSLE